VLAEIMAFGACLESGVKLAQSVEGEQL